MVRRSRDDELDKLDEVYEKVKPYLPGDRELLLLKKARQIPALWKERMGNSSGERKRMRLYSFEDELLLKCGIEKAYYDGKIKWKNQFPVTSTPSELQK